MSNSIMDLVNSQLKPRAQQETQIQRVKNLMSQIKSNQNPQVAFQNMLRQNPNLNNIFNTIQMSNLSPQQFAQMLAQQKGIDLNSLIKELQGN